MLVNGPDQKCNLVPSTASPSRSSGYAPRRAVARRTSPGTSSPVVSKGGAIRPSCGGGALVRGGRVGGEVCAARLDGGRRVKPEARINRGEEGRSKPRAGRRTYRVVLEHAHGRRRSRARELVEEARHGHREEPHRDDAGFHCSRTLG